MPDNNKTVVVIGAIFFYISPTIALYSIGAIPVIIWGSFRYQRSLEPRYSEVRSAAGRMNALLENDLSGMPTIQSFTAEERELVRVESLSNEYRDANRRAIRLSAAFVPLIRMAILVGFTATYLSRIQSGYLYHYAFAMLGGLVIILTWFIYY